MVNPNKKLIKFANTGYVPANEKVRFLDLTGSYKLCAAYIVKELVDEKIINERMVG